MLVWGLLLCVCLRLPSCVFCVSLDFIPVLLDFVVLVGLVTLVPS